MNLLILDAGHAEKVAGKRNEKENFFEWKFNDNMQYKIKKTWTELPHLSLMVVGNLKMKIWGSSPRYA